jgi:hypothetical protein
MGCNFGDLDNDGWLDFYVGTGDPSLSMLIPNRMFRNDGGKRFQEVTSSGGFGHLQKGHGISFADLDNDGDQDIHEEMGGAVSGDVAHNALYLNPGHGNHWITLKLEGVTSNRAAIGARIRAIVQTLEPTRCGRKSASAKPPPSPAWKFSGPSLVAPKSSLDSKWTVSTKSAKTIPKPCSGI